MYLSQAVNILNPGAGNQAYYTTVQTLDNYGNMTQQQVYDYAASSVTRTYNMTYLTDPNYISRYIRNRLTLATATVNGVTTALATNSYDGTSLGALQVPTGYIATTVPHHDSAYDTTFAYRGNLTSSWKMGTIATYAYDIAGNPYLEQDGDGMTVSIATSTSTGASLPSALTPNSNSNLTTSLTYSALFSPISVTGANGATQSQQYDGYNRPEDTISVDGAMTVYSYTFAPNTQTATISTTVNNTTTTQWRRTTFDGFGRTIKVENGHDSSTVNTVDTVYGACGCSPLGKVVKVSMPYGPGETEVWTTYTYDASGRQLTSTAPDGSVTTTSYSGNSVTTTDPAGAWKTNVMDAFGNLIAVYEPDPATGTTTSSSPVTYYTYNGANQLIGVSMTRAGVAQNRAFTYNGSDLISETTPEAGTVTYTYDSNHHVTSRTDAKAQQTQYSYDSYERLIEVRHYTPTGGNNALVEQTNQRVDYYYDTPVASDYTQNNTWGRLSGVVFTTETPTNQNPTFTYEYSYNQAGRVTGNRMLISLGQSYQDLQGQYAWDNQGRMTSMTYPSGPVMNYQFDAMGRPIAMTETACMNSPGSQSGPCGNQTWTAGSATYGSANQLLTIGGGGTTGFGTYQSSACAIVSSISETRTYNNMLQLVSLNSGAESYCGSNYTGGGAQMQYVYNAGHNNGRVAQTIDSDLGETVNYSYDYLHRLTGAVATNGSWGEAYSYDGFGNLTGKTPTVGSAPAFNGSAGSNAAAGNLPAGFDVENRLIAPTSSLSYGYDPWGRRVFVQTSSNAGPTTCESVCYGATGQKLETYTVSFGSEGPAGQTLEGGINTYFAGRMLSEKGVYVAMDRLGSVRGDSAGLNISYFPWGEERGPGTANNRTKFAGYYRDVIGQDYAMARYYSAASGSFWSWDPGGMKTADATRPSSWNRYGYVEGDPINFVDPQGLFLANPCAEDPTQIGCSPDDSPVLKDPNPGGGESGGGGGGGGPTPTPCPPVPVAPANASITQNIQNAVTVATAINASPNDSPSIGRATNLGQKLFWLYQQVRNKGPLDYKQQGSQYENFGNFDFGAVGAALGIDLDTLLRGAGFAQQRAGTSRPGWGSWHGSAPFGDDPADQAQIIAGFAYYQAVKNGCN